MSSNCYEIAGYVCHWVYNYSSMSMFASGADPEGGLWGLETPPSKKCLILK